MYSSIILSHQNNLEKKNKLEALQFLIAKFPERQTYRPIWRKNIELGYKYYTHVR